MDQFQQTESAKIKIKLLQSQINQIELWVWAKKWFNQKRIEYLQSKIEEQKALIPKPVIIWR